MEDKLRFRNLDADGDVTFGKGHSNYVIDSKAIALDVKTKVNSWLGDCFFAQDEGVNYPAFLSKGGRDLLSDDIKRIIVQTNGVAQIKDFIVTFEDRTFRASYTILTVFSQEFKDSIEKFI